MAEINYKQELAALKNDVKSASEKSENAVRGVLSFLIGLPTALAASVLVFTATLVAEGMNLCYSHVRKGLLGENKIIFEPVFKAISESLQSMSVSIWTKWGVYGFIKVGEDAVKFSNGVRGQNGGSGFNQSDIFNDKVPLSAQKQTSEFLNYPKDDHNLPNFHKSDDLNQSIFSTQNNAVDNLSNQGLLTSPSAMQPLSGNVAANPSLNNVQNASPSPTSLPPASGPAPTSPSAQQLDNNKKKKKKR